MNVAERVRADINHAVKAAQRERATALRTVLAELQRAAKEGSSDELAVLRRERKRRIEAATQFRQGGRAELADKEESEAELIGAYMPSELSDSELEAIVAEAISQTGASDPSQLGAVMKVVMSRTAGRADGRRVSEQVRAALHAAGGER